MKNAFSTIIDSKFREALDESAQRLRSGQVVSDEFLQRSFPDLMPDLETHVRNLRILIAAESSVSSDDNSNTNTRESRKYVEEVNTALVGYNVREVTHTGGQGVVLKAVQNSTQRDVAIKVLFEGIIANPRRSHRFSREIRIASRLQLPNIVPVFDSGVAAGHPYFVMPYIDGIPIDDHALLNGLDIKHRVALFIKVTRAVSRAHQRGIIHRDLKPQNILVDSDGEPQILDFGLAKAVSSMLGDDAGEPVSMVGHVVGTLPYLSPEQASGFDAVDVRSDVYSLGVLLFELLTGQYPYDVSDSRERVRERIIRAHPTKLRDAVSEGEWTGLPRAEDFDDDLQAIVSKALAKEKNDRYQSADALADDLSRYLARDIVQARVDQRWYFARRVLRRYRIHIAIGIVVLALLVGSAILSTTMWIKSTHERDGARQIARIAQGTLNDVVTEVNEELEALAGGKTVRKRLLTGIDMRLSELIGLIGSDPELESLSASLLERQGDIARSDGRMQSAELCYLQAIERLSVPAASTPTVDTVRLYRKAGNITTNGVAMLENALTLAREADAIGATNIDDEFATVLIDLARNRFLAGEPVLAASYLDEALTILNGIENEQLLAEALEWEGAIQLKLGRVERARDAQLRCLQLREAMLAKRPYDVRLSFESMSILMRLSYLFAELGDYEQSLATCNQAIEIGEYLVRIDASNPRYEHQYATACMRLASILHQSDDLANAINQTTFVIDRILSLHTSTKDNLDIQELLARAFNQRSDFYRQMENPNAALRDAVSALEMRTTIANQSPGNVECLDRLAIAHEAVGFCLGQAGRKNDALPHLISAREIVRRLYDQQPDVANRILVLARTESNLASWYLLYGDPADYRKVSDQMTEPKLKLFSLMYHHPELRELEYYREVYEAISKNKGLLRRRMEATDEFSETNTVLEATQ